MTSETIITSVGREFSVRLEATPSTGYVWDIEQLPESVQPWGVSMKSWPVSLNNIDMGSKFCHRIG